MYGELTDDIIDNTNNVKSNEIKTDKINNYINQQNILNQETILPIKKKKGRKSNKDKILELEELERNKVPDKLFPTLNEKIFDVIKIDDVEYFLDKEFSIIYDLNINQIGFKKNNKYILYSEHLIDKIIHQLELDTNEISQY